MVTLIYSNAPNEALANVSIKEENWPPIMTEPSPPITLRAELVAPWRSVLISINWLLILLVYVGMHKLLDHYMLPLVIPAEMPKVKLIMETVFMVAFGIVYVRLVAHMVQVFIPWVGSEK